MDFDRTEHTPRSSTSVCRVLPSYARYRYQPGCCSLVHPVKSSNHLLRQVDLLNRLLASEYLDDESTRYNKPPDFHYNQITTYD